MKDADIRVAVTVACHLQLKGFDRVKHSLQFFATKAEAEKGRPSLKAWRPMVGGVDGKIVRFWAVKDGKRALIVLR